MTTHTLSLKALPDNLGIEVTTVPNPNRTASSSLPTLYGWGYIKRIVPSFQLRFFYNAMRRKRTAHRETVVTESGRTQKC